MARPASDIAPRIVHAARERFLFEGVDGASLRNIAKDAGTNIGMVYYYFKTKDELFLAVVEEVYAHLLEDMRRILAEDAPPDQRMAKLYQRVAAMSEDEFKIVRLILREALVSSARLTGLANRFQAGHVPLVLALLGDGVAQERLRSDLHPVAMLGAMFVLGLMPQLARRLLAATELSFAPLLPPPAAVANSMFEILLHGIGKSQAP
ncbi:MAG TPA: TetR/AcrR family transcriptional regulator [Polyangiales bacterium]|nr:TetR/AcrR family transcriptional regulator [Polyangiales bacterium]